MNHWLFLVMETDYPGLWQRQVDLGIAVQHYPPGWANEARNIGLLRQIRPGDMLAAAIRHRRFIGLGKVRGALRRGGRSLRVQGRGRVLEFGERLDVDWHPLPSSLGRAWVECPGRPSVDTALDRGACVKKIDERSFRYVRDRLAAGGVAPFDMPHVVEDDLTAISVEEGHEGRRVGRFVNIYERRHRLREAAVRIHGVKCQACGFDFRAHYGRRGDGYIEVHHAKPVSSLRNRAVNPRLDMVVLCANCHRMVHRDPAQVLSLEDLRSLVRRERKRRRTLGEED